MLFGKMAESTMNEIKLPHVSPIAFAFYQKYTLGINSIITKDNIIDLLHFSKIYLIKSIENDCIATLKIIQKNINDADDIYMILSKLNAFGLDVCVYCYVTCVALSCLLVTCMCMCVVAIAKKSITKIFEIFHSKW